MTMPKSIIYRLPESEDDNILRVQSPPARQIRLRSLQSDPTSFYSKYDVEINYQEEVWLSRLRGPHVQHFVVLTVDDAYDERQEIILDNATEYHAMMVVINEYEDPESKKTALYENTVIPVYFLGCLYVDIAFRSQGWGSKIINEGIEWVRQDARSKSWPVVKYRVTVVDGNDRAVKLYLRNGFKIDGIKVQGGNPDDVSTELSMIIETRQV